MRNRSKELSGTGRGTGAPKSGPAGGKLGRGVGYVTCELINSTMNTPINPATLKLRAVLNKYHSLAAALQCTYLQAMAFYYQQPIATQQALGQLPYNSLGANRDFQRYLIELHGNKLSNYMKANVAPQEFTHWISLGSPTII